MVDQNITDFLARLHITPEGAKIYLFLIRQPAQTAQVIARKTGIPKTTVYRRIEELKSSGLVEEQVEEYKKVFTVASASLLSLQITKKEREVAELRARLPLFTQLLHQSRDNFDPETKVVFYRGRDGIQQMFWNTLHAKTELVGYTYRDATPFIGTDFYDSWSNEFQTRHIKARDLYSDEYTKSRIESTRQEDLGWKEWQSRYIPSEVLDIQHQMDVYNNVVGIYNWISNDVFGVEIYNEKVARLQRQIFGLIWQKGSVQKQKHRYGTAADL